METFWSSSDVWSYIWRWMGTRRPRWCDYCTNSTMLYPRPKYHTILSLWFFFLRFFASGTSLVEKSNCYTENSSDDSSLELVDSPRFKQSVGTALKIAMGLSLKYYWDKSFNGIWLETGISYWCHFCTSMTISGNKGKENWPFVQNPSLNRKCQIRISVSASLTAFSGWNNEKIKERLNIYSLKQIT